MDIPFFIDIKKRGCPAMVLLSDNEFRGIDVLIEALLLYVDEGYVE